MRIIHALDKSIGFVDESAIQYLDCNQTEADTIMFYISAQLRAQGLEKVVVLDSEDTDVYVQSAYVSGKVPQLKINKNTVENSFADCEQLCSSEQRLVMSGS